MVKGRPTTTQHLEKRIRELLLTLSDATLFDIWNKLRDEEYETPDNHVTVWRAIKRIQHDLTQEGYIRTWHKPN